MPSACEADCSAFNHQKYIKLARTVSTGNEHHLVSYEHIVFESGFPMTNQDQKPTQGQKNVQQNQASQQQNQPPGQNKPAQQGDNAAPQNRK